MEKYDFIKMMLSNRKMSINDKKRLVLLATRELEQIGVSKGSTTPQKKSDPTAEPKAKKHVPKDTASFLSLFNNPDGFKFLTHDFDPESEMDYDTLITQVRKVFNNSTKKFEIPKNLYALMHTFIFGGKDKNDKVRMWMDCDGNFHESNYVCEDWVTWSKNNPKVHLLSCDKFGKEILKFRSTIRLVKPVLSDIVAALQTTHKSLSIQTENLNKADFYTYVWALKDGLKRILDDMSRYSEKTPKVIVSFERKFGDEYSERIIKVTQIDSFASSLNDVMKKYKAKGGAFFEIGNVFSGYCNWSVESLWDGNAKRWNILKDTDINEIEDVNNTDVVGFTHILTFFSK